MKVLLRNDSGFSLVQVIVAMGIAGMLSVFLMRLTENMQRTQRYAEVKNNELEIFSRVGNYLNIPSMCNAAVGQLRPGDQFNILQFNTQGLGSKWIKGEEITGTGLIVHNLQIRTNPIPMGDKGLYEVTLRMTLKRKDGKLLMAGTTKVKDYAFVARLCEGTTFIIDGAVNYGGALQRCHNLGNSAGVEYYDWEPTEKEYISGDMITCNICGPAKAIAQCGT
jgi:hypothetical protein